MDYLDGRDCIDASGKVAEGSRAAVPASELPS